MSSSDIAVTVENLSKCYRIGLEEQAHDTFIGAMSSWVKSPFSNFKQLRKLTQFGENGEAQDIIWALKDVSFEVKRGDVIGVIGRNGAGKSTLLKILSHITEPSSGRIILNGRVSSLLEVGTGFHPELTGRENIYLNGTILGMSKKEVDRKFDEIVDFSGVERFIDTPVKRYSSGMAVRLAFSVAGHLDPEILLVDEVLAVGDVGFQKKCLGKMKDVAMEGRTVMFVSHNMGAVRGLCRNGLWIDHGTIIKSGKIISVASEYLESVYDNTASVCDLADVKRSGEYGTAIRLVRVGLNDNKPVRHGEPLKVLFTFETYKPVEDISIGIGFSSLEGFRLLTFDSDLTEKPPKFTAGYRGNLQMDLPELYLQPGIYNIDVGIRSGPQIGLDYLPSSFQVEVLPGTTTPNQIIRSDGGVRIPANWSWETAEAI